MKFKVGDRVACYDYERFTGIIYQYKDNKYYVDLDKFCGMTNKGRWFHEKQIRRLVKK